MTRRSLTVLSAAALAILAWERLGGDLWVAQAWGSPHGFLWRDHVLLRVVLHDGGRWVASVALVVWAVWSSMPSPPDAGPDRAQRWRALGLTLGLLLLVPILKRWSLASCPWDMTQFGGLASYQSHWSLWWPGSGDGGPGHCFPAGHATTGFAFLPGLWMWWLHDRRKAWAWGAAALMFGALMSAVQTVRGAHFVSHHLWTAWLCCTVCAVSARWLWHGVTSDSVASQYRHARPIPQTFDRT